MRRTGETNRSGEFKGRKLPSPLKVNEPRRKLMKLSPTTQSLQNKERKLSLNCDRYSIFRDTREYIGRSKNINTDLESTNDLIIDNLDVTSKEEKVVDTKETTEDGDVNDYGNRVSHGEIDDKGNGVKEKEMKSDGGGDGDGEDDEEDGGGDKEGEGDEEDCGGDDEDDTLTEDIDNDTSNVLDISVMVDLNEAAIGDVREEDVAMCNKEDCCDVDMCKDSICEGTTCHDHNGKDNCGDNFSDGPSDDVTSDVNLTHYYDCDNASNETVAKHDEVREQSVCDRPFLDLGRYLPAYVYIKKFSLIIERLVFQKM